MAENQSTPNVHPELRERILESVMGLVAEETARIKEQEEQQNLFIQEKLREVSEREQEVQRREARLLQDAEQFNALVTTVQAIQEEREILIRNEQDIRKRRVHLDNKLAEVLATLTSENQADASIITKRLASLDARVQNTSPLYGERGTPPAGAFSSGPPTETSYQALPVSTEAVHTFNRTSQLLGILCVLARDCDVFEVTSSRDDFDTILLKVDELYPEVNATAYPYGSYYAALSQLALEGFLEEVNPGARPYRVRLTTRVSNPETFLVYAKPGPKRRAALRAVPQDERG